MLMRRRRRRLAVLISGGGYGNFGDDVILARWLRFYAGWDLVLVCGENIASFVARRLVTSIPLHGLDDTRIGQIENLAQNYRKTCVHLTGGGFCNDKFGTAKNIFALIQRMYARALILGTGVSFYPLSAESKEILNRTTFNYISFRDQFSREIYNGSNGYLTGDDLIDAFRPVRLIRKEARDLYINIQNQFEVRENISSIAKKLSDLIEKEQYLRVFVAELCPGDLDILDYIDRERVLVLTYAEVMAGKLHIGPGDDFIATRFHFRVLAEYSGSTGISIIADDYYKNKHEIGTSTVNFLKNRTRVQSIREFISEECSMPLKEFSMNWRRYFKWIERFWLYLLLRARLWRNRHTARGQVA